MTTSLLALASDAVYLAADEDTKGPEFGKASPVGLLVIVVLLVAVFLLIRSMNRQLRKLPDSFDADHPEADQAFDEGTDTVDGAAETGTEPDTDSDEVQRGDPAHTSRSERSDDSGAAG